MITLKPWVAIDTQTHLSFDHAFLAMSVDPSVRFRAESDPYRVRNGRLEVPGGKNDWGWVECTLSRRELEKMTWFRLDLTTGTDASVAGCLVTIGQ